ncbi:MAG: hypothetical protein K2Q21_01770 [Chitinophagaceae bacterium]|nr:hypothetical protein [Chitinophagaceae bacterium]
MKTHLRILCLFIFLSFQTGLFAHTVVVKGTVKDSSNFSLANVAVKIYSTDSSFNGCLIAHTVYTNPNGYYIDTLQCNGDIRKLMIVVINCDGQRIIHDPAVTSTGIVESNFVICANPNTVIRPNCKAVFTFHIIDSSVQFNSKESYATYFPGTVTDSIISRTWYFGDSSAPLTGNRIDPIHIYKKTGIYNVVLVIKTKSGCESKYTATVTIKTVVPSTTCKAFFNFTVRDGVVKFNSNDAKAAGTTDSIISRYWVFGETSNTINTVLQGNIVDPTHGYARPGKYYATLYIKTRSGCESRYTDTIIISKVNCNATAAFTTERISPKKIAFNSEFSKIETGDSIIQRNWKFGDNSFLSGNKINPVKEYPSLGIYTACLQIKTLYGCIAETCKQVIVQDSLNNPNIPNDFIKIMAINPNPVITHMRATIYSSSNNLETEIAIYDIYGIFKSSIKKILAKGNNIIEIETVSLYHGPYFLRVLSKNGKDSKIFYKL